jgi:uncharacterized protein YutE (UPF0331/DUF86 family)
MSDEFNDLIHSVPTSRALLQKAHKDGSLIEGLCLYVSTIDALLRLALVYTRTQKAPNYTYEIPKLLIRQDEGEKTYTEKKIYDITLEEGIISRDLHQRLYGMYDYRNKIVHRFNISGITYAEVGKVCTEFEPIYQEVFEIVNVLENGPRGGPREMTKEERVKAVKQIADKIGE